MGDTRKARLPRIVEKRSGGGWVRPPIGSNWLLFDVEMKSAALAAAAARTGGGGDGGR